jgi:glyceraldehyde-3-phosphate dehydrogenase (NAD(P))
MHDLQQMSRGEGFENRALYERAGVKTIYKGGQKHEVAGYSFVAKANFEEAFGRQSTKVVSCNTTALVRVLGAFHLLGLRSFCVGRPPPWENHKNGIINTVP